MLYTAEEQDTQPPGPNRQTAALEIPSDMIEFHVARARPVRAPAFAHTLRRL